MSSIKTFVGGFLRIPALFIPVFLILFSGAQAETVLTNPTPEPKDKVSVSFNGKNLFYVQGRVLSFSPEDRARIISERISKLSKDPLARVDSLSVVDAETTTDIVAGDLVIMTVTNQDAKIEGRPRKQLAEEIAKKIRETIEAYRENYTLRSILLGALFTAIATGVLVALLLVFNKVFPKVYARINLWRGTEIRSIKLQNLEILPADRIADGLIALIKMARVVAVLLIFYFYLPLVFSFFPWTRGLAGTFLDYILTPLNATLHGFLAYLPDLFFVVVIIFVVRYLLKFIKLIFNEIGRGTIGFPGFYREWAHPTYQIVRFLIIAFTAVVIFPYLPGAKSPAFQGISIFLGILFSLGSTSAVANVVAGVILTYMRGFTIGDRVKISDTVGDVVDKTLLVTRIRTIKNVDVTIPNAMVLGSHIINYSASEKTNGLILNTSVTIGYDAPWRKVHELLISAAHSTENILEKPAAFVLQTGLNDFYVSYELNAYTKRPDLMAATYSALHQNIQDKFNEAGVEIMSPHYGALRDGNRTAIPGDYLPKGYQPQAFRVDPARPSAAKADGKEPIKE